MVDIVTLLYVFLCNLLLLLVILPPLQFSVKLSFAVTWPCRRLYENKFCKFLSTVI
jgi:hypothetical protein